MNRAITQILYEVAEIIMGQSPESESYNDKGDGIPFYQGKSDFGEVYPTVRMYCTSPKKIAMANDILMSVRAPIGDVNIAREKCCIGRGLAAIRPRGENNLKYLFYLLDYYKERLAEQGTGSTFKAVGKDILKEFKIPVWNLEKQQMIADIVDEIQQLIFIRREALSVLDELVKSRFIEMFGDPVRNPMNWEKGLLKDITSKIGSGATPKGGNASYKNEGISLIRSMNVHNGYFDYKGLAYIDGEQAALLDNVNIESKDVLLNITGASVARCCVVPDDILPARVNQHVCILRCKDDILPMFLNAVLISDQYQAKLWNIAEAGATRQALSKEKIETFQIILPPISLQKQFANFVDLIDKSKLSIQQSIENLQTLKAKLMQEYFG